MRHPTEGVLRRLLDEPAGVADADRRHAADCPRCAADLTALRADADLVAAALAVEVGDVDVDAAWRRLPTAAAVRGTTVRSTRLREVLRRPAAGVLAAAVVLTGAGTAAANDWLQVFRTQEVAPVGLSAADLVALPDLGAYGRLAVDGEPDVREVADAAAAEAASGLDVPRVTDLPRGVSGGPQYQVGDRLTATFTFSAERAARAAREQGQQLPPPPPGLDGSAVRMVAGPGVVQLWTSDAGAPALLVARAVAPTAFSSGLPFETVRDYLLALPGLPDDVAAQLRTFAADGATLPLPVPEERATTRQVRVDGAPATLVVTRDRTLAGVVWVEDGVVTVVAGSLDDDEVLTVARELR